MPRRARALEHGARGEVYNFGGGAERENIEIVRRIVEALGVPASLVTHIADRPAHDRRYAMDWSKARRALGWAPRWSFEDGLAATVAWYRTQETWWRAVKDGSYRQFYQAWYEERNGMKIGVVGTGYVGLVIGAGLAETGNSVTCADVNEGKIAKLRAGEIPIFEPGLEPLVARNQAEGRLVFTTDVGAAVRASEVVFIAVGTPQDEDGSADLRHVLDVAQIIGANMNAPKVVVTKSTVPVGTAERVKAAIASQTKETFWVVSNPEFLKEGAAIQDFMKPDRIVIGTDSPEAERILRELYEPFVRQGNPIVFMDIPSAEVTKYAANAMLAVRITMMNQFANLCERVGANVESVRAGIGTDERIGRLFLYPGPGYGGSCFPKDVKALVATGTDVGYPLEVLEAVDRVNARQQRVPFDKLRALAGNLRGKRVRCGGSPSRPIPTTCASPRRWS